MYNSGDKHKPGICALQNAASIVDLFSVATIDQVSCSTIVGAKDCGTRSRKATALCMERRKRKRKEKVETWKHTRASVEEPVEPVRKVRSTSSSECAVSWHNAKVEKETNRRSC